MALPTQVWTMGWRVPRAARGLGVEVGGWHTVPPLDGLLCCDRCPHHGRPRLCCGVERAGRALVRWCRLLCARAPCCAASVPGRRRPAHICAQSLSMLWVCGMEQGWAILQVEHPPDEASWRNPNVTRTADARPTHRQTARADQRARGPQRDGIARAAPNHQSEPPGRRRVGEKPTRLRENAWKFRGSSLPVRETNTASQGKRLRRCLFLLFGSTESEAVFVSFVWVNSCRKD